VDESQGVELARHLMARGIPVILYDPAAMDNARSVLGEGAICASSAEECVSQADVVVLTTPWDEFRDLSPRHLNCSNGRPVLVDCWRMLDWERNTAGVDYVPLGVGQSR